MSQSLQNNVMLLKLEEWIEKVTNLSLGRCKIEKMANNKDVLIILMRDPENNKRTSYIYFWTTGGLIEVNSFEDSVRLLICQ